VVVVVVGGGGRESMSIESWSSSDDARESTCFDSRVTIGFLTRLPTVLPGTVVVVVDRESTSIESWSVCWL
jgi:hypothetical protein